MSVIIISSSNLSTLSYDIQKYIMYVLIVLTSCHPTSIALRLFFSYVIQPHMGTTIIIDPFAASRIIDFSLFFKITCG